MSAANEPVRFTRIPTLEEFVSSFAWNSDDLLVLRLQGEHQSGPCLGHMEPCGRAGLYIMLDYEDNPFHDQSTHRLCEDHLRAWQQEDAEREMPDWVSSDPEQAFHGRGDALGAGWQSWFQDAWNNR